MAATRTHLRSVAGVNANHLASPGIRLVRQKTPEPGETPGVQAAARFPASLLGAAANAHQILHDDHGAWLDGIDDTPTQHMVAVAPEAVDLPGQLAEVPFGRAGAFALETATEPEVPALDLLPAAFAKESVVGADGGARKAHVYTNHIAGWAKLHIFERKDNMKTEPTLAVDQIGTIERNGLAKQLLRMAVYGEWNLEPTRHGGQPDDMLGWLQRIGTGVIAHRTQSGAGAGRLAALFLKGKGGLQRFCRLHPCCDQQLRRQVWELLPEGVVGGVVQPDAVLLPMRPSVRSDGIETLGVLAQRFQKYARLLRIWSQLKPNRSPHVLYVTTILLGGEGGAPPHA